MAQAQQDLFGRADIYPPGFVYAREIITPDDEHALLAQIPSLPFKAFEFHGFIGKRRVVSFGWRYDFAAARLSRIDDIPDFLLPARAKAAAFAGIAPEALAHALVTEYAPGAAIGWHKDRPVFGDVIGLSLLAPCTFRLRRKQGGKPGDSWERISLTAEPRSAYVLRGASREAWEHSIPALPQLRYSVTFRTVTGGS